MVLYIRIGVCVCVGVRVWVCVCVCVCVCVWCVCVYSYLMHHPNHHCMIGMKPSDELVQLEVLYSSRGHKIDDLTKQLELLQDDYEKELRIAGHEKRQLQQQKELLLSQIQQKDDELQHLQNELNKTIESLESAHTQASTLDALQTEVSIYSVSYV